MCQKVTLSAFHFHLYDTSLSYISIPHMITLESQFLQRNTICFNNTNEKAQIHYVQDASHWAGSLAEVQLWTFWKNLSIKEWGHILSCGKSESNNCLCCPFPGQVLVKPGNKIDRAEYLLWLGSCLSLIMCLQLPYEIKNQNFNVWEEKKIPES